MRAKGERNLGVWRIRSARKVAEKCKNFGTKRALAASSGQEDVRVTVRKNQRRIVAEPLS